jgi:hypothetical protein
MLIEEWNMTDNSNHKVEAENEEPKNPFEQFVEHQRKAVDETAKAIEALLPEGFVKHGREARKEFVAGCKVLVDAAISEMEKIAKQSEKVDDDGDQPSTTGKSKVKVQVD